MLTHRLLQPGNIVERQPAAQMVEASASFLAEISVRPPRKVYVHII